MLADRFRDRTENHASFSSARLKVVRRKTESNTRHSNLAKVHRMFSDPRRAPEWLCSFKRGYTALVGLEQLGIYVVQGLGLHPPWIWDAHSSTGF